MRLVPGGHHRFPPGDLLGVVRVPDLDRAAGGGVLGRRAAARVAVRADSTASAVTASVATPTAGAMRRFMSCSSVARHGAARRRRGSEPAWHRRRDARTAWVRAATRRGRRTAVRRAASLAEMLGEANTHRYTRLLLDGGSFSGRGPGTDATGEARRRGYGRRARRRRASPVASVPGPRPLKEPPSSRSRV